MKHLRLRTEGFIESTNTASNCAYVDMNWARAVNSRTQSKEMPLWGTDFVWNCYDLIQRACGRYRPPILIVRLQPI